MTQSSGIWTTRQISRTNSFKVPALNVLVVAGGGGGGGGYNAPLCGWGGGGGGGVIEEFSYGVTAGASITVTVGGGGSGGTNGSNSVFGNLTAIGGGHGPNPDTTTSGGCGGGRRSTGISNVEVQSS